MQTLDILSNLRIPLALVGNFSFTKAADVVPTSRLHLRVRGFQCRELTVALTLTPASVDLFNGANRELQFVDFSDLVKYFLSVNPSRDLEPFGVTLAGVAIVPELQFTLTSVTRSLAADRNGAVTRCDLSLAMTGTRRAKVSAALPVTSADASTTIPTVTLHCATRELVCRDDVSISAFELTPTTLRLGLLISDSFRNKKDNAWAFTLAQADDSFVAVDGFGNFYISAASFDGDFMELECDIFDRTQRARITTTITDGTLSAVAAALPGRINFSTKDALRTLPISHYIIDGTTADTLRQVADAVGCLVAFRDNAATLYEVPPGLYSKDAMPFPYADDVISAKTAGVILRDGAHEYKTIDGKGDVIEVDSPVCTDRDRSAEVLRLRRFLEAQITLDAPLDTRVRHHSVVALVKDRRYIYCLVTDYTFDFLQNTMSLTLNYLDR